MSTQAAIRAALPAISVIVSKPTSGRPSSAAEVPNPIMYTAGNPASSTSRAASGSNAPGATMVRPDPSRARSQAGPPGRRVSRAVIARKAGRCDDPRPATSSPRRSAGAQAGWLADPRERARLRVVAAGVQLDDPAVPDRDDVIGPITVLPAAMLVESGRAHHQDHLVPGRDDLLKLGSQPEGG